MLRRAKKEEKPVVPETSGTKPLSRFQYLCQTMPAQND